MGFAFKKAFVGPSWGILRGTGMGLMWGQLAKMEMRWASLWGMGGQEGGRWEGARGGGRAVERGEPSTARDRAPPDCPPDQLRTCRIAGRLTGHPTYSPDRPSERPPDRPAIVSPLAAKCALVERSSRGGSGRSPGTGVKAARRALLAVPFVGKDGVAGVGGAARRAVAPKGEGFIWQFVVPAFHPKCIIENNSEVDCPDGSTICWILYFSRALERFPSP